MVRSTVSHIYDFYGRFYDVFEIFFRRRLGRAISPIPFRPGDRVLDVGVGTGFSLRHYPRGVEVTGIDNSPAMLTAARRRVRRGRVRARVRLITADALQLPFADRSFDVVLLSHVIATVTDPQRCLAEALRVARDQALVVLVNHFQSPHPVMRRLERTFDPLCRRLGWRNDLSLAALLPPVNGNADGLPRHARRAMFQTVYLQKTQDGPRIICLPAPVAFQPRLDPA